jgi:cytoskeletal protein CcmA (bactofilin family)/DNA-directed RNA polymerase subunit RPC12/RpoP
MPASKQDKVLVACPHCGHPQTEPRTAFSTVCQKCHGHFHVQEVLHPARKAVAAPPETRRIACFDCGAELQVPVSAESTMCKRCSHYVDLKDYKIANVVSKNFRTKGQFTIEPKGFVFNTEAVVGNAVLKGRFHGKLRAEHSLTIYSTAEIQGSFQTARLVIPAANYFRWQEPLQVGSAEIAGELVNNLRAEGTVVLKSTARLFGDLAARHLVVEEGAVVVGSLSIGPKSS